MKIFHCDPTHWAIMQALRSLGSDIMQERLNLLSTPPFGRKLSIPSSVSFISYISRGSTLLPKMTALKRKRIWNEENLEEKSFHCIFRHFCRFSSCLIENFPLLIFLQMLDCLLLIAINDFFRWCQQTWSTVKAHYADLQTRNSPLSQLKPVVQNCWDSEAKL